MHGNDQQAYDRGTNIFSPDGRLYQVEYAREAVERGSATVGVRTEEGVVLAAESQPHSPLMEPASVEKLHKLDDHIGASSAGHVADARKLVDVARRQAQVNQLRYGEPADVETLTKYITDHVQESTQVGGARPYGAALIIGGVDADGTPRLYETDPSGTPYEWQAVAIGGDSDEIHAYLEREYEDELALDDGIELVLSALGRVNDGFEPGHVSVATVDTETESFSHLDESTVADHLADLDLLESEGDNE